MTKYMVLWKSDTNTDGLADEKFDNLHDILASHNWDTNRVHKTGTCAILDGYIDKMCTDLPNDSYFIYIDDYVQLINVGGKMEPHANASDPAYLLEKIGDEFHNKKYKCLLICVRGKNSGLSALDYVQLISNPDFHYSYSMAAHINDDPDHYDLFPELLQYEDITCDKIWAAMKAAANTVNSAFQQGAGWKPE